MRHIRRPAPVVALVLVLVATLTGCTVNGSVIATDQERRTFETGDAPYVVIETFNGRISVEATADASVEARVTMRGSGITEEAAERDLANVDVEMPDPLGNRITITARRIGAATTLGNSGADVEVVVPEGASVELRTSNGRVESANVEGTVIVRTSNGPITTRGGKWLDLDTTNGDVSVNSPQGPGQLFIHTSNGAIDIVAAKDVSVVIAQTSNGPITFSGTLLTGSHTFATSNRNISITLPADTAFSIDGQTSNGFVRTEFSALDRTDTSLTGSTGLIPRTSITARTSNGDLSVLTQKP